jgi:uncharacterized protein (DUF58 family)
MQANKKIDGITWISTQNLIQLRQQAKQLPLNSGKIHAKQGGAYLSSFKGRGMEFDESRIYLPGDDIRSMDWRVTARTGTAHTKVFREERERPVLLWLDLNASMMFATRGAFKAVVASKIAALLAWSTANNNDRLGALIFAGSSHTEIRPKRGKNAALDLIGRISHHAAWHETDQQQRDMPAAVSRLRKVARPGSLIFMISDFREMNHSAETRLANIARHSDVVMIHITDPIETQLPERGQYQVSDGDKIIRLNTADRSLRNTYQHRFDAHRTQLQKLCRQNRMYYLSISTQDDVLLSLQQGLGLRAGMSNQFRAK